MNSQDELYRYSQHAQRYAGQSDKASAVSVVVFTLIIGYVIYYALQFAGFPAEQIAFSLKFHVRKTLARLGLLPTQRGFAGPRRLSTGSSALDSAIGGALAPLKAASGDRALRTFGGLLGGAQPDAPPGLGNWDNSCYQNSVIQGLASLRPIDSFLTKALSFYGKALGESTNSTLSDTIHQLNDTVNNGKVLWMPKNLKSMSTWQQQDAQEYFSKILDEVDRELLRVRRDNTTLPGLAKQNNSSEQPALATSVFSNPLEGFLAQRVACTQCGYSEGLSMIPFNCLTVPLGRDWKYDLGDCLDEYTKLEAIEGVDCAKCTLLKTQAQLQQLLQNAAQNPSLQRSVKSRLEAVKTVLESDDYSDKALSSTCQIPKKTWQSTTKSRQAVVARAPESLVIHVNRSVFNENTGAQTKNYAEVNFPSLLDLSPWCLGKQEGRNNREDWTMNPTESMLPDERSQGDKRQIMYSLRAVVTHYGRHENGHYICYRRHPTITEDASKDVSERWWRLSDEDVSPVTEDEVLQQGGVFMLFYEQCGAPLPPSELERSMIASSIPLPDEEQVQIQDEPDWHDKETVASSRDEDVMVSEPHQETLLTAEQLAQKAAIEASKTCLMEELRTALPPVLQDHEFTAIGEGTHGDGSEDYVPEAYSEDATDEESVPEQDRFTPPLPQASSSSVKMRTAGAAQERRSSEALDSPLRMASAF